MVPAVIQPVHVRHLFNKGIQVLLQTVIIPGLGVSAHHPQMVQDVMLHPAHLIYMACQEGIILFQLSLICRHNKSSSCTKYGSAQPVPADIRNTRPGLRGCPAAV